MLHRGRSHNRENVERINNQSENLENSDISSNRNKISLSAQNIVNDNHVLLSTVVIDIFDFQNKRYKARALLDMGSQSNFITDKFCSILKLKMAPTNVKMNECLGKCNVRIQSRINAYSINLSCLVVPSITDNIPNVPIDKSHFEIPDNLILADLNFHVPGEIDLLIGGEWFWDILCVGQIKLSNRGPYIHKSRFGWIVTGPIQSESVSEIRCHLSKETDIDRQLTRFWEIEEFSIKRRNYVSGISKILAFVTIPAVS